MNTVSDKESALKQTIFHLSLATFSSMALQRVCDPMLIALTKEFNVGLGEAAAVVGWFAIVYGMVQLIYGPLSDRYGKYRVVALATLACTVGCVGSALALSLPQLVYSRMFSAAFAAALVPVSMAWVGDAVAYESRQEFLARLGLGSTMGIFGGQIMGGVFVDTIGWRWAFALMAMLFFSAGCLLWSQRKKVALLFASHHEAPNSRHQPFYQKLIQVLSIARARTILLMVLIEGACAFGLIALSPSHLANKHQIGLGLAGGCTALFGLGGVFYMSNAKRFIRRLGETGMIRTGTIMFLLNFCVIAWSPVWWLALPASALAGLCFFMFHNTMQLLATQMHPQQRATCMSLFAGFLFTGQSIGVMIVANLAAVYGTTWVLFAGAIILGGCGQIFPCLISSKSNHEH